MPGKKAYTKEVLEAGLVDKAQSKRDVEEIARSMPTPKRRSFSESQVEAAERMEFTRNAIVRLRSPGQVVQAIMKKYGCKLAAAQVLLYKTRSFIREEYVGADREQLRAEMRDSLNHVVAQALSKTSVVKNGDGSVVLDMNQASPNYGRPIVRTTPDLKAATSALRELVHLDGLQQEIQLKVKLEGDINVIPDIHSLGKDAAMALHAFVRHLSPGGNVNKFAGDDFQLSGADPVVLDAAYDEVPATTDPEPEDDEVS